jgi:hypothetical protein
MPYFVYGDGSLFGGDKLVAPRDSGWMDAPLKINLQYPHGYNSERGIIRSFNGLTSEDSKRLHELRLKSQSKFEERKRLGDLLVENLGGPTFMMRSK